jgi:hypothetical protein
LALGVSFEQTQDCVHDALLGLRLSHLMLVCDRSHRVRHDLVGLVLARPVLELLFEDV